MSLTDNSDPLNEVEAAVVNLKMLPLVKPLAEMEAMLPVVIPAMMLKMLPVTPAEPEATRLKRLPLVKAVAEMEATTPVVVAPSAMTRVLVELRLALPRDSLEAEA